MDNSDEAMFTFQLNDTEDPVFAYAEGIPNNYLDSEVNQSIQVITHEITLSPETEFSISVALTSINPTCDDPINFFGYRSLKELNGVLEGDKPLILIHGIQLKNATCDEFLDYYPEEELFEPLIDELRTDNTIKNNFKLYTYRYTSNAPVLENSVALWDMMQEKGIEEPVIIAHSMGGLVARGLMLAEGEDKVTGLITLGTPHEGSPIADLGVTISIDDIIDCSQLTEMYFCFARDLGLAFTPKTRGFLDLRENSEFISSLIELGGSSDKVFTVAGNLPLVSTDWEVFRDRFSNYSLSTRMAYYLGNRYMTNNSIENDGVVPLDSAVPNWATNLTVLDNHNHSEVVRGWNNNAGTIFNSIRPTLLQFISTTTIPQLVTKDVEDITSSSAVSGGQISNDGGATITVRGVCWSTSQNPTIEDNCTNDGSGTGEFTSSITGLNPDTEYFVRAYATNEQGTGYGEEKNFTTDSESGSGDWPRDTTTEIVDVYNPATGRTWMDRNLGASRAATSMDDEQAYGDLYQWGRAADGHEKRNSGTTSTLSSSDTPGHGDFILNSSYPYDWRSPQNDNLWQGVNGINNPCPDGYRLPTEAEWEAERQSWSSNNSVVAIESPLKLPVAGRRGYSSGSIFDVGSYGYYWSSTVSGTRSRYLFFNSSAARMFSYYRAYGFSVRCIKD